VHPLGADRRVWDPVRPRLERERDLIVLDMPGFGASPPLPADPPPTPAVIAAALARFLAELGLDGPPHVAGCSLGGWVALELAVAGHVASVTAIAPAGLWARPLGPARTAARRAARAAAPFAGLLVRDHRARRVALAGVVAHPDRMPAEAAAHMVRAYGDARGFDAVNEAMRAGVFTRLGEIRVPVSLGWPEHDRLIAQPRALPATVRSVLLPDAGHVPMWDTPEAVAELILTGSRPA
jgi:pimeloyl-ACP methyl ester carboxylesterase